jgi:hypothetical protein
LAKIGHGPCNALKDEQNGRVGLSEGPLSVIRCLEYTKGEETAQDDGIDLQLHRVFYTVYSTAK